MSGHRKRGEMHYLTYKVKSPNPAFDPGRPVHPKENPRHLWRQKAIPVSTDYTTFQVFKEKFDYNRRRGILGLHNDRKTWGDFAADFERHSKGKRRSTHLRDVGVMKHLVRILAPETVPQLTYQKMAHYFEVRKREGAMAGTLRAEYAHLRAAFNMAITWKYITENPLEGVAQPRASQRMERYLKPKPEPGGDMNEEGRLLKAAAGRGPEDVLFALLFLDAGIRLQEATHALREWVNLERGVLRVAPWPGEDWSTKNYLAREVPLTKRLRKALEGVLVGPGGPKDPLVVGPNGFWGWRTVEAHFTAIFKAAGIEDATIHTLRHDFCTRMHRKGVRLRVIQRWMGHANIKTTEGYCHADDEEGLEAMRQVEAVMPE